jgi:hypothetical protein
MRQAADAKLVRFLAEKKKVLHFAKGEGRSGHPNGLKERHEC